MAIYNNHLKNEFKPVSALEEDEANLMEIGDISVSNRNVDIGAKGFDSDNGFSNSYGQNNFAPESLTKTSSNNFNECRLYNKNSEEEFTTWPKRRIKLQGESVDGDNKRIGDEVSTKSEYRCAEIHIAVSDYEPFDIHQRYLMEETKMESTPTEALCNLPEEHPSRSDDLFEDNAVVSTAGTSFLASNSEIFTGIKNHILDLPDLVMEHVFGYLSLKDLSQKVRPVCRSFHMLSSRILRLEFRNIFMRLNATLQKLENQLPGSWNPICAEVLTCKLLQSEMETLRAACSRQIETGHYCFIYGDVLQEYHNILDAIRDGKINGMLDGFSDTLIKLNEKPLKYWDARYDDEDLPLGEMKLLGVEIVEVLLSALNASVCVVVTHQPTFGFASNSDDKQGEDSSGSCMMAGCVTIDHSTELKAPPTDHISVKAQRRAILRYIRSLVRANNCDIVLHKLRAYSKENQAGTAPLPVFEQRAWALCQSKVIHSNMVQESYKKDPVIDHMCTPVPDCNMHLICSFEMVCPKKVNPFGLGLDRLRQSPLSSEITVNEEKDTHGSTLAETLSGDHYIFKMDFKTWTPESSAEQTIEIENYVTKTNRWYLTINNNSSAIDSST